MVCEPAPTVVAVPVFGLVKGWVTSEAVTVMDPADPKVRLKLPLPEESAAADGSEARVSLEDRETVSVLALTRFQLASTARTVTASATPTVCAVGLPVLPVAVPGAAVSPGIRT